MEAAQSLANHAALALLLARRAEESQKGALAVEREEDRSTGARFAVSLSLFRGPNLATVMRACLCLPYLLALERQE